MGLISVSDELRDWAEHTYEVFVPESVRRWVYDRMHEYSYSEKEEVGEFTYISKRFGKNLLSVTFVPDREPIMEYDIPLNDGLTLLRAVLSADSAAEAENLIIAGGGYPILIESEYTE